MGVTTDQRKKISLGILDARALEEGYSALVGWVLVAEFMDENGGRTLVRLDSNASVEGLPVWTREGYLHDALFGDDWTRDDDDESETDEAA